MKINYRLMLAVEYADEQLVEQYVSKDRDDVNKRSPPLGRTPLHIAVSMDNIVIARLLLQNGAKIDEVSDDNLTALHIAVANQSIRMVELLLKYGAMVKPVVVKFMRKTPLFMAVEYGNLEIARMLLDKGASVQESTVGTLSLVNLAFKSGNKDMMRLVLKYDVSGTLDLKDRIQGKHLIFINIYPVY